MWVSDSESLCLISFIDSCISPKISERGEVGRETGCTSDEGDEGTTCWEEGYKCSVGVGNIREEGQQSSMR